MTADLVSKGHLVNLPFGASKTYKHPTSLTLAKRALDAHRIEHFMDAELVERAVRVCLPPRRDAHPNLTRFRALHRSAIPAGRARPTFGQ